MCDDVYCAPVPATETTQLFTRFAADHTCTHVCKQSAITLQLAIP